jgi:hypothetical protein
MEFAAIRRNFKTVGRTLKAEGKKTPLKERKNFRTLRRRENERNRFSRKAN